MVDEQQLRRSIGRVRRRIRLQRAGDAATLMIVAALGIAGLAVALTKAGRLPEATARLAWLVAAALPLLGALMGAMRKVSLLQAAQLTDITHDLRGRMANAIEFCSLPDAQRTPFVQAAVEDAGTRLRHVDPARALPWRWPRQAMAVAALGAAVGLLTVIQVPPQRQAQPSPPSLHARLLHPDDVDAFAREVDEVRRDTKLPEPVRETARELNELLEALADRKLSPSEAMRRIRALERELEAMPGDAETLDAALRELAARAQDARITERLKRALREADAEAAARELRKLAERVDRDDIDREELERLRRALDEMADENREKRAERQREIERRRNLLRRQQKKQPQSPRQKRLLQRKRRQLERLQREQRRAQARRRQLQRLRRNLDRSAESLQRNRRSQASQDMQRGAEDLQRMARKQRSQKQRKRLQRRLSEMRELIRRSQKARGGGGDQGERDEQEQRMDRFVRLAKGQRQRKPGDGEGAKPGGKKGEKGEQKQRMHVLREGKDGQGDTMLELREQGGVREVPGSGTAAGDGPGAPLLKDPTQLDGTRVDTRVQGRAQEGPTRSQVIEGASQDGFVSQGYRRVYTDYESHAERVLERDEVPDGYRFYVRRYFQLIRPREDTP